MLIYYGTKSERSSRVNLRGEIFVDFCIIFWCAIQNFPMTQATRVRHVLATCHILSLVARNIATLPSHFLFRHFTSTAQSSEIIYKVNINRPGAPQIKKIFSSFFSNTKKNFNSLFSNFVLKKHFKASCAVVLLIMIQFCDLSW